MQTTVANLITGKAGLIYQDLVNRAPTYNTPHEFIKEVYGYYLENYSNNNSVNGRIFEYAVCETLMREGVTPFYYQAKFAFVPIADFDIVCYHPITPVVLSVKVSLRERYKQAALEGYLFRNVYGAAQSYLITLSSEFEGTRRKVQDSLVVGLTDCLRADMPDFDDLILKLQGVKFIEAQPVVPLTGTVIRT